MNRAAAAIITMGPIGKKRGQRRANELDVLIGARLKQIRHQRGVTLDDFGRELGCGLGHVHRYEKGLCKMSAATIMKAARILGVEPGAFFEDSAALVTAPLGDAASRKLNEAFARITDDAQRKLIASFIDGIARGVFSVTTAVPQPLSVIDGGRP